MRNVFTLPMVLVIGTALAGSAFILSVPPLFRPHEQNQVWITGALGCLFLILAAGMLYLKYSSPQRWYGDSRD
jgi:hypothetical protein